MLWGYYGSVKWSCGGHLDSVHLSSYHLPSACSLCPTLGRTSCCTAGFTIHTNPSPLPPFRRQLLKHSYAWTHWSMCACVRACLPRALAWCDSGFVWNYKVCVEHFQRIYVVAAVTACQIYKAASDPLTRHRCVAVAWSKLTRTSQDYYAQLFSCAPHILGSLYDFAPCNKQVTTSLCLSRHWAQEERHKLIEEVGTNTPESAWCYCSSGWAKLGYESWM